MLVDHVMVQGTNRGDMLHESGGFREVFADLHPGNRSFDRRIVGTRLPGFCVAHLFGIEGVDLGHSATEPEHHAMLGLSERHRVGSVEAGHGNGTGHCSGGTKELTSIHESSGGLELMKNGFLIRGVRGSGSSRDC